MSRKLGKLDAFSKLNNLSSGNERTITGSAEQGNVLRERTAKADALAI
ncbi:hypothetical protein N9B82_01970 [Saprospiraceae bacterium]|nr:hypothetical protein [Saprospiraceae bacterium]